jgi:predicted GNAT family acetyltransferase
MIRRVLEAGRTPFVHIEASNEKSLNLAARTGFVPAGEVWWVKGTLVQG